MLRVPLLRIRATRPAQLILLDLSILTILGEERKSLQLQARKYEDGGNGSLRNSGGQTKIMRSHIITRGS
jgi:hypothetical protein